MAQRETLQKWMAGAERRRSNGPGCRLRFGTWIVAAAIGFGAASSGSALAPPLEIPYFLPLDLAQLEISVTRTEVGEVEKFQPAGAGGPVVWKFARSVSLKRAGALALRTVADPAKQRVLKVPKASWSDERAAVSVTESGLLSGVNASSEGRGGDALLAVAKFAGVAAGFWPAAVVPVASVSAVAGGPEAPAAPPEDPSPTACFAFADLDAEGVPLEMQALVSLETAGCAAFKNWRAATAKVEAMRILRDRLAGEVAAASGTELTELNRKLQSYRIEVAYAESVAEQRRFALATIYDRFAARRCLGESTGTKSFRELLPLDRLPAARDLGWLADGVDLSRGAVREALKAGGWREVAGIFERTGLVATLDDAPAAPARTTEQVKGRVGPASEIAWRQSVPARVRIWALAGSADPVEAFGNDAKACEPAAGDDPDGQARAAIAFDGVIDVLHPNSPIRALPVEAKAFSDRSLTIAFSPNGRPLKFESSGSSSVAGFAQAAAASAQGFRDEYDKSLKSRISIEDSRRELALDGLSDQIAALEAQKKELDARADLLGASGGFDDLVARQKLDSELKLLEAQVALRTAEATADQRAAIAELEKRVLETQKRLALLEAEQALEEARGHN